MTKLSNTLAILFMICFSYQCSRYLVTDNSPREVRQVHTQAVNFERPDEGWNSIGIALAEFGIDVPDSVILIDYDESVSDRAVTFFVNGRRVVLVGPAAFESWAILASTLAHELEVHCRQDPLLILIGGIDFAERNAYLHELRNRKRFGLSKEEARSIRATMQYFYDTDDRWFVGLRMWLTKPR